MKYAKYLTIAMLVVVWYVAAAAIGNDILLPFPHEVVARMVADASTSGFYRVVGMTFVRMAVGLVVAAVCGVALGMTAGLSRRFESFFHPVEVIIKTIPNISYIFLALIWLGQQRSVYLVSFLILFPMFFANAKLAMEQLDPDLHDAMALYLDDGWQRLAKVYIPQLKPYFLSALANGIGLGFKVSVMAEILGQVPDSVGLKLHLCRINLDTTGVMAWTVWIIILVVVLDSILKWVKTYL